MASISTTTTPSPIPSTRYWAPSPSTSLLSTSTSTSSTLTSLSSHSSLGRTPIDPSSESHSKGGNNGEGHRRIKSDVIGMNVLPTGKSLKSSPSMTFLMDKVDIVRHHSRRLTMEDIPIQALRSMNDPCNSTRRISEQLSTTIKPSLLSRSSQMLQSRFSFGRTVKTTDKEMSKTLQTGISDGKGTTIGKIKDNQTTKDESSSSSSSSLPETPPIPHDEINNGITPSANNKELIIDEPISTSSSLQSIYPHPHSQTPIIIHLPPSSPPQIPTIFPLPITSIQTIVSPEPSSWTNTFNLSTQTTTSNNSIESSSNFIFPIPHLNHSILHTSNTTSTIDSINSNIELDFTLVSNVSTEIEVVGLIELSEVFVGAFGKKVDGDVDGDGNGDGKLVVDVGREKDVNGEREFDGLMEILEERLEVQLDDDLKEISEEERLEELNINQPPHPHIRKSLESVPSVIITDYSDFNFKTSTIPSSYPPSFNSDHLALLSFERSDDESTTTTTTTTTTSLDDTSAPITPISEIECPSFTTFDNESWDRNEIPPPTDDDNEKPTTQTSQDLGLPLAYSWTILFANTAKRSIPKFTSPSAIYTGPGYENGLFEIYTASTVQDWVTGWMTYRTGISELANNDGTGLIGLGLESLVAEQTVHCFRSGVLPLWEDEMCKQGGRLSIQTPHVNLDLIFDAIAWAIVGNDLDIPANVVICGVSAIRKDITPRGQGSRIDVWIGGQSRITNEAIVKIREALLEKIPLPEVREARWKKF